MRIEYDLNELVFVFAGPAPRQAQLVLVFDLNGFRRPPFAPTFAAQVLRCLRPLTLFSHLFCLP